MRADGFGDAATKARLSAGMLNGVRGDRLAQIPGEEPVLRPHNPPIVAQRVEQLRREHDVAVPRLREGRLLWPLPWATRITIRWLSSELAVKRTASEMRKPAAQQVVRIAWCLMSLTQPRKWRTSARLRTTGNFLGCLGAGMFAPKFQPLLRVTL